MTFPPIFLWLLVAAVGIVGVIECLRVAGGIYNNGRRWLGGFFTGIGFLGYFFLIYLLFCGGLS